jgi:hypothetical protein
MPTLHDPYADIDRLRWVAAFLIIIGLLLGYNFIIPHLSKVWRLKPIEFVRIFLVALFLSPLLKSVHLPARTLQSPVKSPAYVWPKGCVRRDYDLFDGISRNCGSKAYEIVNYRDYGLYSAAGKGAEVEYFRIDNDAVQMRCDSGLSLAPGCQVIWIRAVSHLAES